jgi:hypothetical protein
LDVAGGNLALALKKFLRTVQGAIQRLEARGPIVMIRKGNGKGCSPCSVVVEKAEIE